MSALEKKERRRCSIADALAIVGDRYSLLIVREIGFGNTRFQQIAQLTGAPRDVLTARLRMLEEVGVLERRKYSERPPRFEYLLTGSGAELRPIVLALKEWGDHNLNPGNEPTVFRHGCGAEFHALTVCAECGEPVVPGELEVVGGSNFRAGSELTW